MKNDIKEKQGALAGEYRKSSDVHGKPSYLNYGNDKAIWYDGKYSWLIGSIGNLGSNTANIYAKNYFGGLTDARNAWKYANNGWKTAGTNDITVECYAGTSKLLKMPLHLKLV